MGTSPNRVAARDTVIRLICFTLLWLVAFSMHLMRRNDPRLATKLGLFAVFMIPSLLLFLLAQYVARYRIPWFVELVGLPFVAGALVYAAVALRHLINTA